METAKAAALSAAQVETADASFTKVELERDDGVAYYEVDFTDAAGQRYEYAVDALTGTVIAGTGGTGTQAAAQGNSTAQGGTAAANGQISEDEAKRIALEDAGGGGSGYRLPAGELGSVMTEFRFTMWNSMLPLPTPNMTTRSMQRMARFAAWIMDAENYTPQKSGTTTSGTTKTEDEIRAIALARGAGCDRQRHHPISG